MKRFLLLFVVVTSLKVFAQDVGPGLKFIENKNQWPSSINYAARIPGGNMMLSPGKFSYYFIDKQKLQELHEEGHHDIPESASHETKFINAHEVEVTLVGGNESSHPQPFGRSSEYYNYYLGSDPSQWASKAYAYQGVIYPSIYSGIDLKVYSKGKNLKYDFVVAPNADPAQVGIHYEGADELYLDNGNLTVKTSLGEMIERRPFSYQIIHGKKIEVKSEYVLTDKTMSFCFPSGYDPCYELVVDPLLIFSTYSGSEADNWGSTATPGEHGNLYSAGVTNHFVHRSNGDSVLSGEFEKTPGAFQTSYGGVFDIGILKYDSTGKHLLYASYLGGANTESPHSLLMNANEELIVLGTTSSNNFPTTSSAFDRTFNRGPFVTPIFIEYNNGSDIFISRISRDGTQLLASTYLGGTDSDGLNVSGGPLTRNYGDDLRGDILTDKTGNIYISSVTSSSDFPMTSSFDTSYNGGMTDAIVVKLNSDLSDILWGAFIGGSETDAAHTIKFDSEENIYVAGGTTSLDFPVTDDSFQSIHAVDFGNSDGWIAKLGVDGDTIYQATFTGTIGFDQVYFLDLNSDDEVYIYGQSDGDMPISPGVYGTPSSGQFLQKFSTDLSTRIFSTTFGSGRTLPDISPTAFLVSDCNNIYMSGWGGIINLFGGWGTDTFGLQTSPDAIQRTTSGSDFYFIVLGEDAKRFLYGTYLGGNQSRTHVDGGTSRFDKEGVVYHAVCSGCVSSNASQTHTSDFPTTTGAWSRTNNSLNCNNAAFKFDLASLKARLEIDGGNAKVCLPDGFKFNNLSSGGIIYFWDFGDTTGTSRPDTASIEHVYEYPGIYDVRLVAFDPATCIVSDTALVKVYAYIPSGEVQSGDDICGGTVYTLQASGGVSYNWYTKDGSFHSGEQNPTVIPHDTTDYFVDILETSGCVHTEKVTLNVVPDIHPDFEIIRHSSCIVRPVILVRSMTDSLLTGDILTFDFGDGTTSDAPEVEHYYERDSVYKVSQTGIRGPCTFKKNVDVPVFTMTIPNVITPGQADSKNDVFTIQFGSETDGVIYTPGDFGFDVSLSIYNRWGRLIYQNNQYNYDWSGDDEAPGVYYYEVKVEDHATCKSWVQVVK